MNKFFVEAEGREIILKAQTVDDAIREVGEGQHLREGEWAPNEQTLDIYCLDTHDVVACNVDVVGTGFLSSLGP